MVHLTRPAICFRYRKEYRRAIQRYVKIVSLSMNLINKLDVGLQFHRIPIHMCSNNRYPCIHNVPGVWSEASGSQPFLSCGPFTFYSLCLNSFYNPKTKPLPQSEPLCQAASQSQWTGFEFHCCHIKWYRPKFHPARCQHSERLPRLFPYPVAYAQLHIMHDMHICTECVCVYYHPTVRPYQFV